MLQAKKRVQRFSEAILPRCSCQDWTHKSGAQNNSPCVATHRVSAMGYVTPAWEYVPIIHCWCRADGGFTEKQCRGSKKPLPVTPVPSPGMCTVLRPTHCLCMRSTISIDDAVAFKVASILRAGFRASYASVAQTTNPKAREFRIPPAPPHEGRVAPQTSNPRSASVP